MQKPRLVSPEEFAWDGDGPAEEVRRVVAAAERADGVAPLDEATLFGLRRGLAGTRLWTVEGRGFAWRHDRALELVVDPSSRRAGVGAALAGAALTEAGALTAWSHNDHVGAARLAATYGFQKVRDLWVMRRSLTGLPPLPAGAPRIRGFRVGQDEDAFLALNAEAFADHPEQGRLERAGLDERIAEPWFDPEGLLLAEREGELLGFHWTKAHDDTLGEVYVVGVSPSAQGRGLGRVLTLAGLHHLAGRGRRDVLLYVEAANAPAIAVYARLGFTHAEHDTHVQYARAEGGFSSASG